MKKIAQIVIALGSSLIASQTITLHDGWNLVSFSEKPANESFWTISELNLPSQVDRIYGEVETYIEGDLINTLSSVSAGNGYWIKSNGESIISVNGVAASSSLTGYHTDWNLVGFTSSDTVSNFMTISSECGIVIDRIYGEVETYIVGDLINTLNDIEVGKGYWVKVSSINEDTLATCQSASSSSFTFNSTTGIGEKLVSYDGITATEITVTLPVGTFDIYAEYTGTSSTTKQVIDTTVYDENSDQVSVLGNGITDTTTPAKLTLSNNSGSEKTYTFSVSQTDLSAAAVSGNIWMGIIDQDDTTTYTKGGTLSIGDVETNVGEILSSGGSHNWTFSTDSNGAGQYSLAVSTDYESGLNPLKFFSVDFQVSGNNQDVISSVATTDGSISVGSLSLEADSDYVITINGETTKSDLLGYYKIKLIKN